MEVAWLAMACLPAKVNAQESGERGLDFVNHLGFPVSGPDMNAIGHHGGRSAKAGANTRTTSR
jgi:hypothetical protein